MEKIKNKNLFLIYAVSISLIVFFIVLIRAATTAITWDEAFTYIAYSKNFNISQLINIKGNLANNHIINTLAIAAIDRMCDLQYNEFIIRLPNIIMLVFYFIGSYMISKDKKNKYMLFTGLILNYYVMEFFGLGRGYGIACSFIVWMCYYFKKAMQNKFDDKNIILSVILGLFACYSNTVSILALFSICMVYLIEIYKKKDIWGFIKRNIIKIIPLAIMLMYIIIFHFIVTGSDKPVFGNTGDKKGMTIIGFLEKSFVWMFVQNPIISISISIIGIIAIIVSMVVYKNKLIEKPLFLQMIILIVALILPSILLRKPFLIERCLIPLWPMLVLGLNEMYIMWTNNINLTVKKVMTSSIIVLIIIMFGVRIDIKKTRTWEDNYKVRDIVYQALVENRKLTKEEYEECKEIYGLSFYNEKIKMEYGFDVIPNN